MQPQKMLLSLFSFAAGLTRRSSDGLQGSTDLFAVPWVTQFTCWHGARDG